MKKNKKNFKKGLTLVETLVAIALFVLGIQATVLVFNKTFENKRYSLEMGRASFTVSRSIGDLTRYIRKARQSDSGAYPIVSADDDDIIFYSDYDKDDVTERLHVYFADSNGDGTADTIYMGVRNPSGGFPVTYAVGDGETITLAQHIVNTASDHVFSYYDRDYPATNEVATPANVSEIRLIRIFLKINIDPNKAPENIQQETFVEVRNLNDYNRIQ